MVEKCFSVWMDQYIPNDLFIDFFLVSFIYVYAQKKLHWIYFFIYSCSLVNILRMQISRHITSQASLSLMLFLKYISITPFQMLFCLGSDSTSSICFLGTSHFPFIRRLQRGPLLGAKDNASIPSLTHWTSSFSQITSWLLPHAPYTVPHTLCPMRRLIFSAESLELHDLKPLFHFLKGLQCASIELSAEEEMISKRRQDLSTTEHTV